MNNLIKMISSQEKSTLGIVPKSRILAELLAKVFTSYQSDFIKAFYSHNIIKF